MDCNDSNDCNINNKNGIRAKRHTSNGSNGVVKQVRDRDRDRAVPEVTQICKYKKLKEENILLNSRLRISLKQNEALINITRHITKCLELMRKLDSLRSQTCNACNACKTSIDKQENESEMDDLNSQIQASDQLANEWRLKYENIEREPNHTNDAFSSPGMHCFHISFMS